MSDLSRVCAPSRMMAPICGLAPRHPDWAWLWQSAILIVSRNALPPLSRTPHSRAPWIADAYGGGGTRDRNNYGPSYLFPNMTLVDVPCHGWRWLDSATTDYSDTWTGLQESFTVAGVFDDRLKHTAIRLFHIYTEIGTPGNYRSFMLMFFPPSKYYQWQYWPGPVVKICNMFDFDAIDRRFVVTVNLLKNETRFYSAGKLATSWTGQSPGLRKITGIYMGCDYNAKESTCLGGTMGPLIVTRGTWSQAQVTQWTADPWGFLRFNEGIRIPFWLPPPTRICQVSGRDTPALLAERDVPAVPEGREDPVVDSQDRDIDVEDYPSPRKTDVEGQSC